MGAIQIVLPQFTEVETLMSKIHLKAALDSSQENLSFFSEAIFHTPAHQGIVGLALEAAGAGMWTWDVAANKIYWSEKLEALYGFKPRTFDGTYETYMASVYPPHRESLAAIVQKAISDGQPYVTEHRANTPDGREVWLQGRGQAFYGSDGQLVRMAGITIDITERKRKDELIARKSLELDRFAAIAAHDLMAPLNSITQFSELLASQYSGKLGDDANQYIDFIVSAGDRMRNLIDSLLSYARAGAIQSENFTEVSLNTVLTNVQKNLFAQVAQTNANIESDDLPTVVGNEIKLTQLFQNLISNAIKYSRVGVKPEVRVKFKDAENSLVFVIEDNGEGIDQKHLPRIFDFFSRVGSREIDGSGIGLAICKKIVEVHGGNIWAESELGQGSKFHFTLSKTNV